MALRVLIADDEVLLSAGIARLLEDGFVAGRGACSAVARVGG
jgi:hypothetical protein